MRRMTTLRLAAALCGEILASAAVAVVPVPPPPIAEVLVAPPPIVMAPTPPRPDPAEPSTTSTIDVEIRHPGGLLWKGSLAISSRGGASFTQQSQESFGCAPDPALVPGRASFGREPQRSSMLRVQLGHPYRGLPEKQNLWSVQVEWTRPMSPTGPVSPSCSRADPGTLTARIMTEAELPLGKPLTIKGDAGLVVTLVRHEGTP